ncbi:hypothetical protein ILUMI_25959, partial [Ignelater luminosus]
MAHIIQVIIMTLLVLLLFPYLGYSTLRRACYTCEVMPPHHICTNIYMKYSWRQCEFDTLSWKAGFVDGDCGTLILGPASPSHDITQWFHRTNAVYQIQTSRLITEAFGLGVLSETPCILLAWFQEDEIIYSNLFVDVPSREFKVCGNQSFCDLLTRDNYTEFTMLGFKIKSCTSCNTSFCNGPVKSKATTLSFYEIVLTSI